MWAGLRRVQVMLARQFWRSLDLVLIWIGLLVGQHFVPVDEMLARADLLPWMVLALSLCALLRARPFGDGHHPMLTPRIDATSKWARRAAGAAAPWALLFYYDGCFHEDPEAFARAAVCVSVTFIGAFLGHQHGQTAWNPTRSSPWVRLFLVVLFFVVIIGGLAQSAGVLVRSADPSSSLVHALARAAVIGFGFLSVGLVSGRLRNLRQRYAAGQKDNTPYRPNLFPALLSIVGPMTTIALMLWLIKNLTFDLAFVTALMVVVWSFVVWPNPSPIMVSVVLHEVRPTGGADPLPMGTANAFDTPPQGALRFSPAETRRTLVMHPWLVPVRSSRIKDLDDPVKPLWDARPPLPADHILGECAFEPDPFTKMDQWEVMTIRLKGLEDMASMYGTSAAVQRMVILRSYPAPGTDTRSRLATYRWDVSVPETSVQVLDPTTASPKAEIRDGDVLLISQEGVAKAFEVEIGAPVYRLADANAFRPPQLEDYVEV